MRPIKKSVLTFESFKLGLLIAIVIGIFTRRINPIVAGKVIGIAGLLSIRGLLFLPCFLPEGPQ